MTSRVSASGAYLSASDQRFCPGLTSTLVTPSLECAAVAAECPVAWATPARVMETAPTMSTAAAVTTSRPRRVSRTGVLVATRRGATGRTGVLVAA